MKDSQTEGAKGVDFGGAMISRNAGLEETCEAHGFYTVKCTGPREEDRELYTALRNKIEALSANFATRLLNARWLKELRAQLAAFPLEEKWADTAVNVVTTVGKNLALDTYLAGSAYTVTGPYMGLISSTSWSAVAAADTMSSHAGWLEAGNANAPTYTSPRKTAAWSAASAGAKALSSALTFAITGSGTVKGCFLVYGTGALTTVDNTAGTLLSAGLFTGGDKVVSGSDSLQVSYSQSL